MAKKYNWETLKDKIENSSDCKLLKYDRVIGKGGKQRMVLYLKCSCGQAFQIFLDSFNNGKKQCNNCSRNKLREERAYKIDEVKEILLKHNLKLLSSEYVNNREKIKVQCLICSHIRECSFGSIFKKHRCPECRRINDIITVDKFKKRVEKIININEYYIHYEDYKGLKDKIRIKHILCGREFKLSALRICEEGKYLCKKCYGKTYVRKREDFIKDMNNLEPNNYMLLSEYKNTHEPILLKHIECGTIYQTEPRDFLKGYGRCPKCKQYITSRGELGIQKLLERYNIDYKNQYSFEDLVSESGRKLRFDFAVFNNNSIKFLIEYDGEQHFRPVNFGGINDDRAEEYHKRLKINDELKNIYCKNNNIKIYRIPYTNFNKLESITTNILLEESLIHDKQI